MRKRKVNKYKVAILILCIIFLLLIISLLILEKKQAESEKVEFVEYEEFVETYQNEVVYPRNMTEMTAFEGDNESYKLYESLKVFVDYISYLNENVNASDSQDFYNNNTDEIKEKLGITEEATFVSLMEYIAQNNVNVKDFNYAEIEPGTSYVEDRYFTFTLNLYYGEENDMVQVEVGFAEKINNRIPVKYRTIQ